jgi:hypothetical protein
MSVRIDEIEGTLILKAVLIDCNARHLETELGIISLQLSSGVAGGCRDIFRRRNKSDSG